MKRFLQRVCFGILACYGSLAWSAAITDITVFSTNEIGHYWLGWIWNTRGSNTDAPNRWNLYVSSDDLSDTTPQFFNHDNNQLTEVALSLGPGTNTFSIYGEGVGSTAAFQPFLHFVLNLYFDGNTTAPLISGLAPDSSTTVLQAADHPFGLGIFGEAPRPEAGSLSTQIGNQLITLTDFSWLTNGVNGQQRDIVWPHWANDPPYATGSRTLDYFGSFTLEVAQVPEPATIVLFTLGLGWLGLQRAKRAG